MLPWCASMKQLAAFKFLIRADPDRFIERTMFRVRWATIASLFLISLAQPTAGRTRAPEWALILVFAGYNLLIERAGHHLPGPPSFAWIAILDLPACGLLYLTCNEAGGPLFVFLVLAAAQTVAFMTLGGSLLYTSALGFIAAAIEPTFSDWTVTPHDIRALVARLVILALVGVGMSTLTRRLLTEQRAALSMLGQTERLATLERLRTDFIASVSHELRTPLTAARAGLGMLEVSVADRIQRDESDLLANARRNVERLSLLIDDLLAYNQIEAGTLRLDAELLDLRIIVVDAAAAIHPLVHAKGQTIELDLPEALPHRGDGVRLEQVMLNVIANAHRYTPAGGRISVMGRVAADIVHLSVVDNGPGIPAAELEAIFKRFYRLAHGESGSGLGLAVARGVVELHGGRIWAENAMRTGTAFHIELPRAGFGTGGES